MYTDSTFSSRCETCFPPAVGKPFHAVKSASHGSYDDDYCYGLDGSLISSSVWHFDYPSDNHLKLLYLDEQKWARFDYGPSGNRFRQFLESV